MSKRLSLVLVFSIMIYGISMLCAIRQSATAAVDNSSKGVVVDVKVASKSEKQETTPEMITVSETTQPATTEAVTVPVVIVEETTIIPPTTVAVETQTEVSASETVTEKPTVAETKAELQTTKKEKAPKKQPSQKENPTTKKANNTVPAQKEKNVIGAGHRDIIRNSVINMLSGGKESSNMKNLAIYMANNNLSKAQSAADAVCGYNTLSVSARTATVSINSTDTAEILDAGSIVADKLSGKVSGDFGVGVSAKFSNGKYYIYVVVAYLK